MAVPQQATMWFQPSQIIEGELPIMKPSFVQVATPLQSFPIMTPHLLYNQQQPVVFQQASLRIHTI